MQKRGVKSKEGANIETILQRSHTGLTDTHWAEFERSLHMGCLSFHVMSCHVIEACRQAHATSLCPENVYPSSPPHHTTCPAINRRSHVARHHAGNAGKSTQAHQFIQHTRGMVCASQEERKHLQFDHSTHRKDPSSCHNPSLKSQILAHRYFARQPVIHKH